MDIDTLGQAQTLFELRMKTMVMTKNLKQTSWFVLSIIPRTNALFLWQSPKQNSSSLAILPSHWILLHFGCLALFNEHFPFL